MISSFVTGLISKKLAFCAILVLGNYSENQKIANSLISSIPSQVKYTLNLKGYHSIGSTEADLRNESQPIKFNPVNQFSDHCMVTISLVKQFYDVFFGDVESIIAPNFIPVTRMDCDYYIFIAPQSMHSKLLLYDTFVKKIKYKVAIGISISNQLQITTVDFFDGPKGSPKLVTLSNSTKNLFPDYVQSLRNKIVRVSFPGAISLVEGYKPTSSSQIGNGKRGRWKYLFEQYLMVSLTSERLFKVAQNNFNNTSNECYRSSLT